MDREQWIADQRSLRAAVRAHRRTADGRGSLARQQLTPRANIARSAAEQPLRGEGDPLASVIVVCWNSAHVLGRCLDQLFAQDYRNREIIVVDDGSEDDTLSVAREAVSRGRLTIVSSPANRGCPHARNVGLRHANGDIVAFVDADGFAAPDWLSNVVRAFDDATVGGVASTVFFDANPMVINGAGGTVNRQGWAADLSMNQPYERAEIRREVLYAMGCGMAIRRSALEVVGPFDDRMLNYYDDVDYGTRLWRAGYRVIVAADAWIDHGFGQSSGASAEKRLLCERHRMRVVLKHSAIGELARWGTHELRSLRAASASNRAVKLQAAVWNTRHLPSLIAARRRLRNAARVPQQLVADSWGDAFPIGVPLLLTPRPETAVNAIDMADTASAGRLLYGWFPAEHADGRSYRWAGEQAAALIRLPSPVRRLRLEYAHVPVDTGGVAIAIRRAGSPDYLTPIWGTHLTWQYIAQSVENHFLALPAGDYEVVFVAADGWSDPPRETRSLAFALANMSFEASYEPPPGGLDMASPQVDGQLVRGWYEPEQGAGRTYRWATGRAAAVIRLTETASSVTLAYCLPPIPSAVEVTISPLEGREPVWSHRIAWRDGAWHDATLGLRLPAGNYVIDFDAEVAWSNPGQRDPSLWPENRALGFAISSLSFGAAA